MSTLTIFILVAELALAVAFMVKGQIANHRDSDYANGRPYFCHRRRTAVCFCVDARGRALGLKVMYIFRHSAAVRMVEAGVSMEMIAQYLGHDDVETTRRI